MNQGLLSPFKTPTCRALALAAVLLPALVRVCGATDTPPASSSPAASKVSSAAAAPEGAQAPPGMVLIPAGKVRMGHKGIMYGAPVTDIYLDAFYMDIHEVSNGEYKRFMDAGGYTTESYWNPVGWIWKGLQKISAPAQWDSAAVHGGSIQGNEQFPVTGVSWWEADAYARWAGKRLPTEVEWEKAAKGGCEKYGDPKACDSLDTPDYPWAGNWDIHRANARGSGDPYETNGHTTPVGFYDGGLHDGFQTTNTPGPYGVYDTAGNVWEWTSSRFEPYPFDATDGRETPPATFDEESRTVRGASWRNIFPYLRSSSRDAAKPDLRFRTIGIRCVKSIAK